jgi:hypothetical protein
MDYKDMKFVYKGKTFQLDPTEDELTDREMRKNGLPESARKINELAITLEEGKKKYGSIFPKVFKAFENLEKAKEAKVNGKSLDYLIKKKKFDTDPRESKEKAFIMKKTSFEVDHKEGVLEPFDVRVIDRDINRKAGLISRNYMEGKITIEERNAAFENLGYNKDYENFDDFIEERKQFATGPDEIEQIEDMINEKFGLGTMTTADQAPEPDSSILRRLFEDFKKRRGFAEGSPSPLESEATIDQALAALNSSEVRKQFLYDTSPIGKLDKDIFGKDGDRNLMQQFNTQFLDPRSYPYYAQKTLRGGANIPELSVRFPLAAAYLFGKGTLAFENFKRTGDLSKFSMEDIRTAMEILEPKFTNLALEGKLGDVLGLSPEAIQAVEEKRTGPQKTTGSFLQFTGEAVGPATPYIFLTKLFPKLPKQIKDLVGTTSAVDKVNKEIERRASQDGVDQTRRDIVLATAAGAGVGLLKYLGLDTLFKGAPKAVKAAPEIITKGGTPKYFFDFVGLIKSKGKDITDTAALTERQKVYDYNGYTVYENLDTGRITIAKDTEGGGSYYIGDGEYETIDGIIRKEEIVYDPPETILDDAGKPKKVPDTYEESTLKPDEDGSAGDVEPGLESIDEILELLAKDGKKYSLDELKEMGINIEGIGDDFLLRILKDPTELKIDKIRTKGDKAMDEIRKRITGRSDKAGGGIMKMAGDDSGPPPKSGPTPHGLPYVAKNVRPIKERK